jgi:hypothetical protein
MNVEPRIIGLAGVSGAGKDTAGDYLVRCHGYTRIAIADPLKRWVRDIFGLTDAQLWGDERNVPDPRLGRTPREVYQEFGVACTQIDPDVLIRAFCVEAETMVRTGKAVVCTDVRTQREVETIQRKGGTVWRVVRPGAGAPGTASVHATETEIADLPNSLFDGIVQNEGSIAKLHAALSSIVTRI